MDEFAAFGGIDIDDIPDAIQRGKYKCELTKANLRSMNKEDLDTQLGRKLWVIDFEVADNSEFMGETASIFINLFTSPDLGQDPDTKLFLLQGEPCDPQTQTHIRDAIKYYRTVAEQLGFSREELKAGINFEDKVGQYYMVELYPDNSKKARVSNQSPIVSVDETGEISSQLDGLNI